MAAVISLYPYPDYTTWLVVEFVFAIFLALIFWLIYKNTSYEFHKFTKPRLIADCILFAASLAFFAWDVASQRTLISNLFFYFLLPLLALVQFYSIHLAVCSAIMVYNTIKNKLFKKNKKDFITSLLYLVLLNEMVKIVVLYVVFSSLSAQINPLLEEPCGVQVAEVFESYPAAEAGLQAGEMLISVDGTDVNQIKDFTAVINSKKPGDFVSVVTDKSSYDVLLGSNPENSTRIYLGMNIEQIFCIKYESFGNS